MSRTFTLRPNAALEKALSERGESYTWITRRDLERYYHALKASLQSVHLTEPEASLIVDALNGILTEPHTVQLLWANIDDAIRSDGLDRKWEVNGTELIEKLRSFSYCQTLAIVDAVERFWLNPNPLDESLRRVGLTK